LFFVVSGVGVRVGKRRRVGGRSRREERREKRSNSRRLKKKKNSKAAAARKTREEEREKDAGAACVCFRRCIALSELLELSCALLFLSMSRASPNGT
jgi:hypothetical protein